MIYALDPEKKGEILWQTRIASPGPTVGTSVGVQWGMASEGRRVYGATSAYGRTRPTDPGDTRRGEPGSRQTGKAGQNGSRRIGWWGQYYRLWWLI